MPETELALSPLPWTARDLARLEAGAFDRAPRLEDADVRRISRDLDVWDAWPLADIDGTPRRWRSGELWFALAAPAFADPEMRHAHARIHHFHRKDGRFRHLGATFPDGFTPGSREWSGSATIEDGMVTLRFTAAGLRGERDPSFRQRLFASRARLPESGEAFGDWSEPEEIVAPADLHYMTRHEGGGRAGAIKAFRDPSLFRAADGARYVLFTASSAVRRGAHNGVIGLARQESDGMFAKLPPLVDAAGVNNELERPHIVSHGGLCYLFWSTQAGVFAPGIAAPTGLYGAVSTGIGAPWRLLNGHGLVFANPEDAPWQAYSWWVLPDLQVASFVDYRGPGEGPKRGKPRGRAHFGGTFAPFLQLRLDGARAGLG